MYLRAFGEIVHPIDDTLPELKDLVVDAVGQPIRRISRFMQLALIGAGRCARGRDLPGNTAVYLASGRGDLEITIDVMNHVFREGQAPKPLSFVNTVSNSAAFYVAKCLKLESRSAFVSSRYFAFEDALQLALVDFQQGTVDSALIGAVDNVVLPLDAHRERLELATTTPLAEGSHWMWLTREASTDAQGAVIDVYSASDQDQLLRWIAAQNLDSEDTSLSAGQYLPAAELAAIQKQMGLAQVFAYREARGYYASQSAAVISAYLSGQLPGKQLLHINSDSLGRFAAVLVSRR